MGCRASLARSRSGVSAHHLQESLKEGMAVTLVTHKVRGCPVCIHRCNNATQRAFNITLLQAHINISQGSQVKTLTRPS
jgi:hypothetical protein